VCTLGVLALVPAGAFNDEIALVPVCAARREHRNVF
jgi:hypothetical protein